MNADLLAAGHLLAFGLQPRLTASRDSQYAALVHRFLGEPSFSEMVVAIAAGQGLDVLGCDPLGGLVLAPHGAESPYRIRLDDYVVNLSSEQRLLHGLAQLAIAATCYPTAASLDDDAGPLPSVTALEVHERLERLAEAIAARFAGADPPLDQPELEPVWRLMLRTRAADTTSDTRSTPYTTIGMIRRALGFLEKQGLADQVKNPTEADTYRMRSRYRLHVLDAARAALDLLRAMGEGT